MIYSSRLIHFFVVRRTAVTLLSLALLTIAPTIARSHAGHGNEFQGGAKAGATTAIKVDAETAKRMGLKAESVRQARLPFGLKATGQIEALPSQQVEVTAPVGGTVVRLLVSPGESVAAGQPVAVMTSPDLAELRTGALDRRVDAIAEIQQAETDLRLAQQTYKQQQRIAQAEVQQAKTTLSFAQEKYDRDKDLVVNGALPRRQFLESETELATAKASLAETESRLDVLQAGADVERARSAVEAAQSKLQLSANTYATRLQQLGAAANPDGTITITAPISGVVADQDVTQGESTQDAGRAIMSIVNSNQVQVSANIYEKDLKQIEVGQRVRVQNDSAQGFTGRISVIGAVVEGESRVVPVKAVLDNPNGQLKPGMFTELEVLTDATPTAVMTVPSEAIVETNDKKNIVFVQNGETYQPVEVTLGRTAEGTVEISNGLFEGDVVVTQRANQLYAQSLKAAPKDAAHEGATVAPVSQTDNATSWWIIAPVGGIMTIGTFWAGMFWATRRQRVLPMSENSSVNPYGYPELQLNGKGQILPDADMGHQTSENVVAVESVEQESH
jgi:membrane fusion protein, heavy metal efflux system